MVRANSYDAVVIVSFGGPEKPEDVRPFLMNVAQGRDIPEERLAEVAAVYHSHGGGSPANRLNRDLAERLKLALEESGNPMPVYLGNRNWHPYLRDTVREMEADGVRRALAFVTSGFSSYPSCRQYLEDIAAACEGTGVEIHKLRGFFNHPDFIKLQAEAVEASVGELLGEGVPLDGVRIIFTAHSLPQETASVCDYEAQLREASRLVMEAVDWDDLVQGRASEDEAKSVDIVKDLSVRAKGKSEVEAKPSMPHGWDLVWQSRSGPPQVRWLEPDINDHLPAVAFFGRGPERQGRCQAVVVVPIGFISDHMEVINDLDRVAHLTAEDFKLGFRRAATVGGSSDFADLIAKLIAERVDASSERKDVESKGKVFESGLKAVGNFPALPDICPSNCCRIH